MGHALLDSDELDRLYPVPTDQVELNVHNLGAVWSSFAQRGATRLVLVGVLLDVEAELAWLRRAIPDARWIICRLVGSEGTLSERLARREIGSGLEYHEGRSRMQSARFDRAPSPKACISWPQMGGPSSRSPTSSSG